MASFDFQHFLHAVSSAQTESSSSLPDQAQTHTPSNAASAVQHSPSACSSSEPHANGVATRSGSGQQAQQQLGEGRRGTAANALAAAAAAGAPTQLEAAVPEPQGRGVPADDMFVYNVDERLAGEAQPQLEVSPITLYNSDFTLELSRQIAANDHFICYGLKQGHLRVLHKDSADRALLKGHSAPLTDLRFFSDTVNLLASAGKDKRLIIWRLQQTPTGILGDTVRSFSLANGTGPLGSLHASWHPTNQNLIAMTAGSVALLASVSRVGGAGVELAVDVEALPPGVAALPGQREGPLTSLAFSPDGHRLAAGGEDGKVQVWRVEANPLAGGSLVAELSPFLGAPTGCVEWAPSPAPDSRVLLVGNAVNGELQLEALEEGTSTTLQTLLLASAEGQEAFFNHIALQPASGLAVLANSKRNAVYVLHLTGNGDQMRFDYLAEFSVTMPILSMATTAGLQRSSEEAKPSLHLYCVQTQAIQQYSLDPALARPAALPALNGAGSASGMPAAPQLAPIAVSAPAPTIAFAPAPPAARVLEADASAAALAPPVPAMREPAVLAHPPSPPSDAESDAVERLAEQQRPRGRPRDEAEAPGTPPGGAGSAGPPEVAQAELEPERPVTPTSAPHMALPPQPGLLTPTALMKQAQLTSASRSASFASEATDDAVSGISRSPFSPGATASDAASTSGAAAAAGRGGSGTHARQTPRQPSPALDAPAVKLLRRGKQPEVALPPPAAAPQDPVPAPVPHASMPGLSASGSLPPSNGEDTRLAAILETVLAGQRKLTAQVAAAQRETVKAVKGDLAREVKRLEAATDARIAKLLKANLQQLKEERAGMEAEERAGLERLLSAVSTSVNRDLPAKVEGVLKEQLAGLQAGLGQALSPLLKAALADNLPKGGASAEAVEKSLGPQLAGQVAAALARPLQDALRGSFQKQLLPGFEGATAAMFAQVNAALAKGLQEYRQAADVNTAALTQSLQASLAQARGVVESLSADIAEGQRKLVELAGQAGAAPAAGGGPLAGASSLQEVEARQDPTLHLSSLIKAHRYEEAFNQALSLSNVDTVTWLCTQLDTSILNQEPAPLSQGVVLSLIQQLGYDLSTEPITKLSWIREAAVVLNPQDPLMAPHMRPILSSVYGNLQQLAGRAAGAHLSTVRLVMHLINSLLTQCP